MKLRDRLFVSAANGWAYGMLAAAVLMLALAIGGCFARPDPMGEGAWKAMKAVKEMRR